MLLTEGINVFNKNYKNLKKTLQDFIHQVKNANRPWIGREEKVFTLTLRQLGAEIRRTLYFVGEQPSIENHFAVINTLTTDILDHSSGETE